jgi:hypothetical protein
MPPYNPLAEMVNGLIQLVVEILSLLFRLLRFLMRAAGLLGQGQHLGPYEKNRRRAVAAALLLVFCLYVLRDGAWLLHQLPPWVRPALIAAAGVSALFVLTGLYGAHNGPRDPFGVVASLVVAGGCAALLRYQCYLPSGYGVAADDANWALTGLYIAVLAAACLRALICVQLFGGAQRAIARALRRRTRGMRPASSGFWANMRESFARGRDGRRWRD